MNKRRELNIKFFVKALFALKMITKALLLHAKNPSDINKWKNVEFQILSFLTKNPGLISKKKVDFWTKYKIFF